MGYNLKGVVAFTYDGDLFVRKRIAADPEKKEENQIQAKEIKMTSHTESGSILKVLVLLAQILLKLLTGQFFLLTNFKIS